ncbi:hypothetical protein ABZP36_026086 [Zizania latifolia]
MADEWWSAASQRSHGSAACSAAPLTDRATCGWTSPATAAESTGSITFQDPSRSSAAAHHQPLSDAASSLGDPHVEWTQAFLSGRSDASFQAVLQDDMAMAAATRPFRAQSTGVDQSTVVNNPFRDMGMDHGLLLDQASSSLASSSPYGTAAALQGLSSSFDGAAEPVAASHNITTFADYPPSANYGAAAAMQFSQTPSRPSLPVAAQMQFLSTSYQLPFGSAPLPSQLLLQAMQPKPSCSSNSNTLMAKSNSGSTEHACSSAGRKSVPDSPAAATKRPRIEAPSPLPTFKVRKEKLGDRITALQQLVSPFGKTDTASVLHEAIEYIKFLHEQVASLSSPYLKNGNPLQHFHQKGSEGTKDACEAKPDLRSRGLCLVPVASTYTVASETVPEFWHPTFGGTFRQI